MKMAYIGGNFDLFHSGHINILKNAKRIADNVTVCLNTDEFATKYKRRPIMSLDERVDIIKSCKYVDHVMVSSGGRSSRDAIIKSGADVIIHGDDWTGEDYLKQIGIDEKFIRERGILVVYIPYTKGISSSEIIQRCKNTK